MSNRPTKRVKRVEAPRLNPTLELRLRAIFKGLDELKVQHPTQRKRTKRVKDEEDDAKMEDTQAHLCALRLDTLWLSLLLQLDSHILAASNEKALAWIRRVERLPFDEQMTRSRALFAELKFAELKFADKTRGPVASEVMEMLQAWCGVDPQCDSRAIDDQFAHIVPVAPTRSQETTTRSLEDDRQAQRHVELARTLSQAPEEIVPFLNSCIQDVIMSQFPDATPPDMEQDTLVALLPKFLSAEAVGRAANEVRRVLDLRVELTLVAMEPKVPRATRLLEQMGQYSMLRQIDADVGSLFAYCQQQNMDCVLNGDIVHATGSEQTMHVNWDGVRVSVLIQKNAL